MSSQLAIFLYYPFDPLVATGGVQTAFLHWFETLKALRVGCAIVCPGNCHLPKIERLGGILIDRTLRPTTFYEDDIAGRLHNLGVVHSYANLAKRFLIFDHSLPYEPVIPSSLVLNSICYGEEQAALIKGDFEEIIYPSAYLRDATTQIIATLSGIHRRAFKARILAPPRGFPALTRGRKPPRVGDRLRLVFPHRADKGKGLLIAFGALAHLIDEGRDVELHVAREATGSPEDARAVTEYWAEIDDHLRRHPRLLSATRFHDWLPRSQMAAHLRRADCVLFPSLLPESVGLVAWESIDCGTPVVSLGAGALASLRSPLHVVARKATPRCITDAIARAASMKSNSGPPNSYTTQLREFSDQLSRALSDWGVEHRA